MDFVRKLLFGFIREPRKCVLVAWELGGGLGHINRLLAIARELSSLRIRFVFAVRNVSGANAITRVIPDAEILAAPVYRPVAGAPPTNTAGYNYADVLFRCGYDETGTVMDLVSQWRCLFGEIKPDLIICDHSPTVVLAGTGVCPVLHIGSGFATPPAGQPFFPLHVKSAAGAAERERCVLQSIQRVCADLDRPIITHVSQFMAGAECFPCSLPELDPYRSVRSVPAIGPIEPLPQPRAQTDSGFVFGYLTAEDIRLAEILQSLAAAKVNCGIYVREGTAPFEEIVEGTTVTLYDKPQPLAEALYKASAILHHGGLSTAETALAMGRPQFLLPRHLEQRLTADELERLGCGINLRRPGIDIGTSIARTLRDRTLDKAVARVAGRLAERPLNAKSIVVNACLEHLR